MNLTTTDGHKQVQIDREKHEQKNYSTDGQISINKCK
jgi:hypothetical protein